MRLIVENAQFRLLLAFTPVYGHGPASFHDASTLAGPGDHGLRILGRRHGRRVRGWPAVIQRCRRWSWLTGLRGGVFLSRPCVYR